MKWSTMQLHLNKPKSSLVLFPFDMLGAKNLWIRTKELLDLCFSTDPDKSVQPCYTYSSHMLYGVLQAVDTMKNNGWMCFHLFTEMKSFIYMSVICPLHGPPFVWRASVWTVNLLLSRICAACMECALINRHTIETATNSLCTLLHAYWACNRGSPRK